MSSVQRYAVLGALGVIAPALLLSACGSSEEAKPSPTPSVSPTASDSASPRASASPTAPALPEAAKAHTKAGAEAFVRHFLDTANYAQETGETSPLAALSADGCRSCDAGVAGLKTVFAAGGRYDGGTVSVQSLASEIRQAGQQQFAHVEGTLRTAALTIHYPDPSKDVSHKSRVHQNRFELIAVSKGWLMGQFEATE